MLTTRSKGSQESEPKINVFDYDLIVGKKINTGSHRVRIMKAGKVVGYAELENFEELCKSEGIELNAMTGFHREHGPKNGAKFDLDIFLAHSPIDRIRKLRSEVVSARLKNELIINRAMRPPVGNG